MNNKTQFYVSLLALILFLTSDLEAFDVTVVNSITDIIAHQKIRLRIKLDDAEQGVVHDTLRFSIDTPIVTLKNWHASVQPTIMHHLAGKSQRQVYTESFFATIAITIPQDARTKLTTATICVAAFVLTKQDTIKAKTVTTQLSTTPQGCLTPTTPTTSYNPLTQNTHHETVSSAKPLATRTLMNDFSVIDSLAALWYTFIDFCLSLLRWHFLWIIYVGLFLLYVVFKLKPHVPALRYLPPFSPSWNVEFGRACFLTLAGITLYYAHNWLSAAWQWFATALFMLIVTLYYAGSVNQPRTLLEKLKLLIGFVCGLLIIPLVIKGLIVLHEKNIFELFGK